MRPVAVPLALVVLAACGTAGLSPSDGAKSDETGFRPGADTDSDADSDSDADGDADGDTDTDVPGTGPWSHTITVDGDVSEWTAAEALDTTSGEAWLTWDAVNLYVAVRHPDVALGGPQHWLVVYLGDGSGAGATAGVPIGTQVPGLPTPMTRCLRWKADDSYDGWLVWDGAAWVESPGWLGSPGSPNEGSAKQESNDNQVVELQIPRSEAGIGETADVHLSWVYEGAGSESTYAGSPFASFAEGAYDPDYVAWWRFELSDVLAPAAYTPLP